MHKTRRLGVLFGLALIIAGCGDGGAEGTTAPADGATTTVAASNGGSDVVMENISFQPDELTVPVGTEVSWTNNDGVSHTTTSEDDLWDSGNLASGESFSFTFDEAGTYSYICTIHPGQMQATVTVQG